MAKIGNGVIIEIIPPQQRQGEAVPPHRRTLPGHRADIEVVHQHQRAGGCQQVEQVRNFADRGHRRGKRAEPHGQEHQRQLEQFDQRQRRQHRAHRRHGFIAMIARKQFQHDKQPGQIARHFAHARHQAGTTRGRSDHAPQRGNCHRADYGAAGATPAAMPVDQPDHQQHRGKGHGQFQPVPGGSPGEHMAHRFSAPLRSTAPPAAFAAGSAGPGTGCSSWHNTGRIPACAANPRSRRHRDN